MSSGQWRVFGLLLLLLALELVIQPAIKQGLAGLLNGFNTALSQASPGGK